MSHHARVFRMSSLGSGFAFVLRLRGRLRLPVGSAILAAGLPTLWGLLPQLIALTAGVMTKAANKSGHFAFVTVGSGTH